MLAALIMLMNTIQWATLIKHFVIVKWIILSRDAEEFTLKSVLEVFFIDIYLDNGDKTSRYSE